MTTALYRRYRPETFAEVIGQPQVTEPLRRALLAGRVGHAYLFSGPRGCGKTTSARILARTLNCEQNAPEHPIDIPCGECDSCLDLATGGPGSLDVVEIDAASHGGVDDARDLRDRATFAPTRDRFKIFIIDEAHMVSPQGFNALLKIVEEPPPHVKFFFATTEPDRVLPTIRSRTHHYPFRLVPSDVLGPYIEQICEREGFRLGQGVLPLVLRAGAGSVRDTLSVLDQLIAGADGDSVEYESAVALLGYTDAALLDEVVDAIATRDGAALFGVIERIIETGHPPQRFVEDLLGRLRDLIVIAVAGDAAEAALRDQPPGEYEQMRGQANSLGLARLSDAADLVSAGLQDMTGATSPRLQVELLAARLLLGDKSSATEPALSTRHSAAAQPSAESTPPQAEQLGQPQPLAPKAPTPPPAPRPAIASPTRHSAAAQPSAESTPPQAEQLGQPQPPTTKAPTPSPAPETAAPASDDQHWLDLAAAAKSKQEIGDIGKRAKDAGASAETLAKLRDQYRNAKSPPRAKPSRPASPRESSQGPPSGRASQASRPGTASQSGTTAQPARSRASSAPPEPSEPPPDDAFEEAWERGYPDDVWLDPDKVPPLADGPASFDDEPAPDPEGEPLTRPKGPAVADRQPKEQAAPEPTKPSPPPQQVAEPAAAIDKAAMDPADPEPDDDEFAAMSDDDPELESSGLVGVPLVLKILGGRIVAEETDGD